MPKKEEPLLPADLGHGVLNEKANLSGNGANTGKSQLSGQDSPISIRSTGPGSKKKPYPECEGTHFIGHRG